MEIKKNDSNKIHLPQFLWKSLHYFVAQCYEYNYVTCGLFFMVIGLGKVMVFVFV